jgi:hypothetical protein
LYGIRSKYGRTAPACQAPGRECRQIAAVAALALVLAAAAPAPGQSIGELSHDIGLYADMAADTLSSATGGIIAPVPHVALEGVYPVPGLDFFVSSYSMACADFDQDGWTDVLVTSSRYSRYGDDPSEARLLWGRPDGLFEVAEPSPVPRHIVSAVRGDVDGDGLTDLVVSAISDRTAPAGVDVHRLPHLDAARVEVLTNQGGRRFTSTVIAHKITLLSALADLDGDGWLDLLGDDPFSLTGYGQPSQPRVWLGGPTGLAATTILRPPGTSSMVSPLFWVADLDGDGRSELRVIACPGFMSFDTKKLENWLLETLEGGQRWRPSALAPTEGCTAVSLADVDGDGRPDIFAGTGDVAGGRNVLRLSGPGGWPDVGRQAGLWAGYSYTTGVWGDADNDGRIDLWQCREVADAGVTRSRFYWNRGDTTFVDATATAVTPPAEPSSDAAVWIDTDRDGRLDLLAGFMTAYADSMPVRRCRPILYRNAGEAGAWIGLELEGAPPNTDAIGASAVVWSQGRPQWRQVGDGSSDGRSAPPLVMHVGLGDADRADSVTVQWPWGARETWRNLPAGRRHVLRQGAAPGGGRQGRQGGQER